MKTTLLPPCNSKAVIGTVCSFSPKLSITIHQVPFVWEVEEEEGSAEMTPARDCRGRKA